MWWGTLNLSTCVLACEAHTSSGRQSAPSTMQGSNIRASSQIVLSPTLPGGREDLKASGPVWALDRFSVHHWLVAHPVHRGVPGCAVGACPLAETAAGPAAAHRDAISMVLFSSLLDTMQGFATGQLSIKTREQPPADACMVALQATNSVCGI